MGTPICRAAIYRKTQPCLSNLTAVATFEIEPIYEYPT